MRKLAISLIPVCIGSHAQNCNHLNLAIDPYFSYVKDKYDFSLPFNYGWSIELENQKAVTAVLADVQQLATASILFETNGFRQHERYTTF